MSEVIGKGHDAGVVLMGEVDNLFNMTGKQRGRMLKVLRQATKDEESSMTYEEFYHESGLNLCKIAGQPIEAEHNTDGDGNPDGGWMEAPGIAIRWQRGAIDPDDEDGRPWNGAFSVTVLECLRHRLEYFQTTKFACDDNSMALSLLGETIDLLNKRQIERFTRGVRGKHKE